MSADRVKLTLRVSRELRDRVAACAKSMGKSVQVFAVEGLGELCDQLDRQSDAADAEPFGLAKLLAETHESPTLRALRAGKPIVMDDAAADLVGGIDRSPLPYWRTAPVEYEAPVTHGIGYCGSPACIPRYYCDKPGLCQARGAVVDVSA